MEDIIRDADADVRRERALAAWKKYGRGFTALALGAVIATAVYVWKQDQAEQTRLLANLSYDKALTARTQGNSQDATTAIQETIALQHNEGFGALAQFEKAYAFAKSGDANKAIQEFLTIAAAGGIDPIFAEFATITAGYYALDADWNPALDSALQKIIVSNSTWRPAAQEITALKLLKADKKQAVSLFDALEKDAGTPGAMKQRARYLKALHTE